MHSPCSEPHSPGTHALQLGLAVSIARYSNCSVLRCQPDKPHTVCSCRPSLCVCRESRQLSKPSAGAVLQSDTPRRHRLGVKKSTAVLLGRLLMAGLLIVAGSRQVGWLFLELSFSAALLVSAFNCQLAAAGKLPAEYACSRLSMALPRAGLQCASPANGLTHGSGLKPGRRLQYGR